MIEAEILQDIIHLPACRQHYLRLEAGFVLKLRHAESELSGTFADYKKGVVKGRLFATGDGQPAPAEVLILRKASSAKNLPEHVLITQDGPPVTEELRQKCRWLRPTLTELGDLAAYEAQASRIRHSWSGRFAFKAEVREGDRVVESGLRPPQIGALHAILSHWTVSDEAATVVMPTGTGKTETMLALLVSQRLSRVMVIVPTNALREQIGNKFATLGILPKAGVIGSSDELPLVGFLEHRPKSADEAEDFVRRCNVVVTTASVLGQSAGEVTTRIASLCSHLIVDEAHHVAAPTWDHIRATFKAKRILQFTATPYRSDGKLVDGRVIYNYPLRKAQLERYFKPIRFQAIQEFNPEKHDERVAAAALGVLAADVEGKGLDHLLMARCASIDRAKQVFDVYRRLAPQYRPVLAHSDLTATENREVVRQLRSRESRVVVCVSMFGEGFDLPELKVAALHQTHKSLAVTLQFTGRFTRTNPRVGDATIVANIADVEVEEALQSLYGEDPDWNHLLRELSERATGEQVLRTEFVRGFAELPEHVPLQNVFPKMSTVVYTTQCDAWQPQRAPGVLKKLFDRPALHPKERVMVLVTREYDAVTWGEVRGLSDVSHHLYIIHWDQQSKLFYIHSSNNDSFHEALAKAVCGEQVSLIRGESVFRILSGIKRLVLLNLGLGHSLSRAVRFTMHVGVDIKEGLTLAHAQHKFKTNLFGRGFEAGARSSVGASRKGRVWSFQVAKDIGEWVAWCHRIGRKLMDQTISVSDVLAGAMIPRQVADRPPLRPLAIEWSEDLLDRSEEAVKVALAGKDAHLYDVTLELADNAESGPIVFRLRSDAWATPHIEFEVRFADGRVSYVTRGGATPEIRIGKRVMPLGEYLQAEPPVIRFVDGSFLIHDDLFTPPDAQPVLYDRARIEAWDWTGVDITKESQQLIKRPDSVQRKVIETLLQLGEDERFDIVFDDDNPGEAADVVAVRVEKDRMLVRLYHCKFSKAAMPGARVEDLYAVCGQAQSSVHWRERLEALFDHLAKREGKRLAAGSVSRFERGDLALLKQIKRQLRAMRPDLQVYVVQPGLSRDAAKKDHLELLAATELHLKETRNVPLVVVGSA